MSDSKEKYTREFRRQALRLLEVSDESIPMVAARLGMSRWTLRSWYRAEMGKKPKRPTKRRVGSAKKSSAAVSQEERIRQLEQELMETKAQLRQAEEEKLILKKAAAFFAKEST